jgi:hypothetical protein
MRVGGALVVVACVVLGLYLVLRRTTSGPAWEGPVSLEASLVLLPLPAPWNARDAEYSGMAVWPHAEGPRWVLLPQYPARLDDRLPWWDGPTLEAALAGAPLPPPRVLPLVPGHGLADIPGWEGLEAIAFGDQGQVALAVEARVQGRMRAHVVMGRVEEAGLRLDGCRAEFPLTVDLDNKAVESLVWVGPERVLAIFEVGDDRYVDAVAWDVHPGDCTMRAVPAPATAWRLTDAGPLEDDGVHFALMQYHWPGDRNLAGGNDAVWSRWPRGSTHADHAHVERVVWGRLLPEGGWALALERAPLHLPLTATPRNWEGLAPLAGGWLVVTDRHPGSLLGWVGPPQ